VSPKTDTEVANPYLFFEGRCGSRRILPSNAGCRGNATRPLQRCPDPAMHPPGAEDKVMHASFRIGDTTLLAADRRCQGITKPLRLSLSLSVSSERGGGAFVRRPWADGGRIQVPLGKTAFSQRFGTVVDRLGVSWTITVAAQRKKSS
jgi:PhnB protein